jgi:hypothetical protein
MENTENDYDAAIDRLLGEHSEPVVSNRGFLLRSVTRKYHLRNNLDRWNYLYRHYGAEYCEVRRRLFVKAHKRTIGSMSSTELCLTERYTACVNFNQAKDGLLRHVCDLLPIVIGSELDLRVRAEFWSRGRPTVLEDIPKIGFIIQNKNYYNFTACLTTNPKVCHIYRRNTKLQNTEVRLYYYDHNFRGNKLYLKQNLVFEKCENCCQNDGNVGACRMEIYVQEMLMLRNCYKHDYTFITRKCRHAEKHQTVRETIAWICGANDQQQQAGVQPLGSSSKVNGGDNLPYRRPVCADIFSSCGTTKTLKFQCARNISSFVLCDCPSPVLMQEYDDPSTEAIVFENVDRMTELNNSCFAASSKYHSLDAASNTAVIEKMFTLFIYMHEVLLRNEDIDLLCNKCIFEGPILYGQFMQQLSSYLCEKYSLAALFTDVVDTLISKMRELSHTGNLYMLISRKTNIRVDLTNDMKRLLKTNVKREKMQNVDVCSNVKTFASSSTVNSGGVSGSAGTPVDGGASYVDGGDAASGNNCSPNNNTSTSNTDTFGERLDASDIAAARGIAAALQASSSSVGNSLCTGGIAPGASNTLDAFAANSNSDFLLRRKQRAKRSVLFEPEVVRKFLDSFDERRVRTTMTAMDVDDVGDTDCEESDDGGDGGDGGDDDDNPSSKKSRRSNHGSTIPSSTAAIASTKSFYTGMDPYRPGKVLILYSSIRDYNSRQLLNYGNLYLLQGISAAHYTDTEFIFEQIKRPRITNQQNSSKCALIPRGFVRFLSFYNIGNLSTAGRSMNLCSRTRLSFFVNPVTRVAEQYFSWFLRTYNDDSLFHACYDGAISRLSPMHCIAHQRYRCVRCFLYLIINEVPYCSVLVDKRLEYPMFLMSKLRWSGVQFYRKSHVVLSVSIQSGIIMIPMCLSMDGGRVQPSLSSSQSSAVSTIASTTSATTSWLWCDKCTFYFPQRLHGNTSAIFHLNYDLAFTYNRYLDEKEARVAAGECDDIVDGMFRECDQHVWFSPNDLRYYEKYLSNNGMQQLGNPHYYEIACHGAFSTGRNISSVDISKTIVSINAAKRRLRLGSELQGTLASPFETLMDQNARILVSDRGSSWRPAVLSRDDDLMVLRDRERNEPLRDIITVPGGRNTFYCCFMFGDYEGFNCEDAYVFDANSRPLVENVIQLKVNYYKLDRSVIKTCMVQFFFRPSISLNPGNGCTVFLGEIITYYKLSFGSTMINVKMIRHRNNMYRYCLSYTSYAAYLRRGSPVFADCGSERGLDFDDPVVAVNRYNDQDFLKHNSKSNIMVLYEATAATRNGNVVVGAQMNTRQLRFRVSLRNVRTTQKIQNNCGQKGMPVYRDLGDLYTERGGRVHIIVSSYSLLGRQPLSQLLEQRSNGGCDEQYGPLMRVFSRRLAGQQVGWAGYGEFFFSCDSPHDNIIVSGPNCGNNPMRICNLTYYAAIDSGLSTAIFNRISDHENYKNNPSNGVPLNVYKLLSVYRYFNRDFEFKEFTARRAREQLRDWVFLRSLNINAELPNYLREAAAFLVGDDRSSNGSRSRETVCAESSGGGSSEQPQQQEQLFRPTTPPITADM